MSCGDTLKCLESDVALKQLVPAALFTIVVIVALKAIGNRVGGGAAALTAKF